MKLLNLTAFPIRVGSATAPVIPSSGSAVAVPAVTRAAVELVAFDGLGEIRCEPAAQVARVDWPRKLGDTLEDGEAEPAIVIPLAVAAALRELGQRAPTSGGVYTPGPLREEDGVRFAPHLVRHRDLELPYRR